MGGKDRTRRAHSHYRGTLGVRIIQLSGDHKLLKNRRAMPCACLHAVLLQGLRLWVHAFLCKAAMVTVRASLEGKRFGRALLLVRLAAFRSLRHVMSSEMYLSCGRRHVKHTKQNERAGAPGPGLHSQRLEVTTHSCMLASAQSTPC